MLLREALQAAITRLTAEQVPSPRLNAETLLMFTLNCDRAHLYAHPERELTPEEQSRYDETLTQRSKGVPAQYITGHQEFWGLDLIVSSASPKKTKSSSRYASSSLATQSSPDPPASKPSRS